MPEKKPPLSKEAFETLLAWLGAERERAGEKYATLHQKLVTYFLRSGFSSPETYADEVFNRIARRLSAPGESREILTDDPEKFALGIARMMVAFEWKRQQERKESSFEEWMEAGGENKKTTGDLAEEYVVTEQKQRQDKCLNKCLGKLTADERALLTAYYEFDGQVDHPSHAALAERYGLTRTGLRTRVRRIKEKVRACVQRCVANNE